MMKKMLSTIHYILFGIPAFIFILLMILYSKLLRLDKKVGEEKIIFAFLPKLTNYGKILWLRKVKRKVEYNRDFISWAQYMYYEIFND